MLIEYLLCRNHLPALPHFIRGTQPSSLYCVETILRPFPIFLGAHGCPPFTPRCLLMFQLLVTRREIEISVFTLKRSHLHYSHYNTVCSQSFCYCCDKSLAMYNLSINYYYRHRCIEEHLYTHTHRFGRILEV